MRYNHIIKPLFIPTAMAAIINCTMSFPSSALATTGQVMPDEPTYLDRQHTTLVSQGVLMADTSPYAYAEENTDPFSSLYFGFGANLVRTDVKVTDESSNTDSNSGSDSDNKNSYGVNFNLGYGHDWSTHIYFGGEAFLNFISNDKIFNLEPSIYDFGGALRLGYVFTPHFMLYAIGGLDVISLKINNPDTDADTKTLAKKTEFGLFPGVGAEYLFNNNWGLRVQYVYIAYPDELSVNTDNMDNNGLKYKTNRNMFNINLVYHFNFD